MQELSFKIFDIFDFRCFELHIDDVEAIVLASGWVKIESIGRRPTIVIFQMSVSNAKNMPGEVKVEVDFPTFQTVFTFASESG